MKKKLFISFCLVAIVTSLLSIGAYAGSNLELVKVYLNKSIRISLNNELWTPSDSSGKSTYPITYNGTTYLPLKSLGNALGVGVGYDQTSNTVQILSITNLNNAPTPVETTSPTPTITPAITPSPTPFVEILPKTNTAYDYKLEFPSTRYPETAVHIKQALEKGETAICTIDREGADENRNESLRGIATKTGYDRDEWPMAMCAEGGFGADVTYVSSSDNRGSGSWVGNQLEDYPNGTRILFVININFSYPTPRPIPTPTTTPDVVKYRSCAEVKAAGKAPIRMGDPGYSKSLDRDGDGIACES